jgi:hypothetical protein
VQPLALLLVFLAAGCAREKDLLDEQVRKLCAVDGGVKVYEQVSLPPNKFDEFGIVRVPAKSVARLGDDFYFEWDITYYKKGNPEMWRNHFKLVRRADGKILGESVSYSRRGGDFPGPWHDSSFRCPENADISDINKQVFIRSS